MGQSTQGVFGCPREDDSPDGNKQQREKPHDTNDWMVLRPIFLDFDKQWGPFDVDACCDNDGHNAQVPEFCCPKRSFLEFNCEGKRVFMNPPFSNVMSL